MRGLILDYQGVLDGQSTDPDNWKRLISELRMLGVGIAILTNIDSVDVPPYLEEWREAGLVDEILLSGAIGVEKPEPAAFYAAAEALGESHKDCVLIDDDVITIHAAIKAGLIAVLYTTFERIDAEIRPLFGIH